MSQMSRRAVLSLGLPESKADIISAIHDEHFIYVEDVSKFIQIMNDFVYRKGRDQRRLDTQVSNLVNVLSSVRREE